MVYNMGLEDDVDYSLWQCVVVWYSAMDSEARSNNNKKRKKIDRRNCEYIAQPRQGLSMSHCRNTLI